jgi:hypothetical protein
MPFALGAMIDVTAATQVQVEITSATTANAEQVKILRHAAPARQRRLTQY